MKVYLIGFMGCGKSTVAKKLASRLSYRYVDLDALIEQGEHQSVRELFSEYGEHAFRELEYRYLRKLEEQDHMIVSTGGGTPCYHNNMEYMKSQGVTVYLKMSPQQLFSRLKGNKGERPLLKDKTDDDLLPFIVQKLREREPYYEKAHLAVSGFDLNIRLLEDTILTFKGQ